MASNYTLKDHKGEEITSKSELIDIIIAAQEHAYNNELDLLCREDVYCLQKTFATKHRPDEYKIVLS